MAHIRILIGIPFEPPLVPGTYKVGKYSLILTHPLEFDLEGRKVYLPNGASSVFDVSWVDAKFTEDKFQNTPYQRHEPVHEALEAISKIVLAIKLVRSGHIDSTQIRTVGTSDFMFYKLIVDGKQRATNIRMRHRLYTHPGSLPDTENVDLLGTTALALPQIDADSFPIGRRITRCIELLEHGFHTESIIVSHSLLDDVVQNTLKRVMAQKDLGTSAQRLLRAVERDRIAIYLGPLLKILGNLTIDEIWPSASRAIAWLNKLRNDIAHAGAIGNRDQACLAIFVTTMVIAGLQSRGLFEAELPPGLFRYVRILASWTVEPPAWVIPADKVEADPYPATEPDAQNGVTPAAEA